jgi:hypothetical protein
MKKRRPSSYTGYPRKHGERRVAAAGFTIQPTETTTDSEQGLSQANRVTEQRHEKEKCRLKKADGTLFVC